MSTKRFITLGAVLLFVLLIGGAVAYQHRATLFGSGAPGQVVTLTPDGFTPATLTINQGDTVIFRTTDTRPFWPASDLHPSHLLYPEFDPKDPIAPNATWSFTFKKVGSWRYHDHLAPYFTGTINVNPTQ